MPCLLGLPPASHETRSRRHYRIAYTTNAFSIMNSREGTARHSPRKRAWKETIPTLGSRSLLERTWREQGLENEWTDVNVECPQMKIFTTHKRRESKAQKEDALRSRWNPHGWITPPGQEVIIPTIEVSVKELSCYPRRSTGRSERSLRLSAEPFSSQRKCA